ncbi:MAG: metallophosphoesterase [Phycisphaerales bacterium]
MDERRDKAEMGTGSPVGGRRVRRVLAWVAAWLVLSMMGTALHWGTWIAPAEEPPVPTILGVGVFKQAANFMTIGATPGWIVVTRVAGVFGLTLWDTGHSVWVTAIANGLGWALVLASLAGAWRVARWAGGGANIRAGAAPVKAEPRVDLSRRRLIVNAALATAGVSGVGAAAYGSTVEPWDLRVRRYRVPIRGLPEALEGLKIVQVSDTHLGPRVPAWHVERAMQMALDLQPDLVALTGDYVHNGFYQIAPAVELFSRYVYAYIPVVGVLGNHDWYAGGKAMSESLARLGVRMIDNGRVYWDPKRRQLADEPCADALCLAGVGDLQRDRVDFAAALDGVPEEMPRVVLSHNPDAAEDAGLMRGGPSGRARRVDLMLSGHTHGGQVRLPIIGAPLVPSAFGAKYAHGLNEGPACRVITSAGVGVSLVPLRIGVPPEVVEVVLVRG